MKAKKIIMFIIAVAAFCCMFSLCACDDSTEYNGKVKYEKYDSSNAYSVGDFEYSKSAIRSLDIDWVVGDVTIVQSDAETLKVTESADGLIEEQKVRCLVDGGTLKIKFWKSGYKADTSGINKALTVEIPKGLTEVDVDNINGSVIFDALDAAEVKIETVSGAINVGAINATRDVELESVSGEVKAEKISTSGEVDLQTVGGDIDVGLATASKVDAETVSGDVTLTLIDGLGATVSCNSVSGRLTTQKEYVMSGKRYVFGSGTCEIFIDGVSGTVTIK